MNHPVLSRPVTDDLDYAAALLTRARRTVALTGAGISTPSGIPDFRSDDSGLWGSADPMEVASIFGFRQKPEAFFAWVRPLVGCVLHATPNAAHYALAEMEARGLLQAVITQNIDMLHSRAGSAALYEVHGHLREATCVACYRVYPTSLFIEDFVEMGDMPRCPICASILKPNVILFGEALPLTVIEGARRAAKQCDVMLVVGSSLEVAPASQLPQIARAHGAQIIVMNNSPTPMDDDAAVIIRGDVAVTLPHLVEMLSE